MKKLFSIVATILLLTSCGEHTVIKKTVIILYQDGTREELVLTKKGYYPKVEIYFHNGCLYTIHEETKYDANYRGCIRCGVKNYRVI
jgi:hypothetical protein